MTFFLRIFFSLILISLSLHYLYIQHRYRAVLFSNFFSNCVSKSNENGHFVCQSVNVKVIKLGNICVCVSRFHYCHRVWHNALLCIVVCQWKKNEKKFVQNDDIDVDNVFLGGGGESFSNEKQKQKQNGDENQSRMMMIIINCMTTFQSRLWHHHHLVFLL